MRKNNLITFLKRLDKRDWREFRKFVRSPYFNQREDVIRLFDYLDKAINSLSLAALDKEKVFAEIYPEEIFNTNKLRHTTSVLLKILKKYIIQTELQNDVIQNQQYLYKGFRKKGLDTFYEKEIKVSRNLLEKEIYRDSHFYFRKYEIGMEEATFGIAQRRTEAKDLQPITNDLTIAFIASMMRLSCEIQSHQTLITQTFDLKLLSKILKLIEEGDYDEIPLILLYYHCYNSFGDLNNNKIAKSEIHFDKLKKLIQQHWELIPPIEIKTIYLHAINYCIKRLNAGERHFIREAFELFRSGLKNKTLIYNGILSTFSYKNITRLGMALMENEWVEDFLESYKKYLHPRERDNNWRYNLAFFNFQQQKYKSAMQLLLQVEFKDVLYNLDARRILLKSYYELGEYNALDSLLDSFLQYIHRQKDIGYHRENNLNLVRFVKKIIHSRLEDKQIIHQLINEIAATNRLAEREWLLEKLKK